MYISNSSSVGGAPAALLNLVQELVPEHEVAVILPDSSGPLYEKLVQLGVRCYASVNYRLTVWPRVINPVKFVRRIYSLTSGRKALTEYISSVIDEFCPDIVHTNVGPLDLVLDICKEKNIPHVWHLREFQTGMRFFPSRSRFYERIQEDHNINIAISRCVAAQWHLGPADRIIYDGIASEESFVCPDAVPRERSFLYVGRIEPGKRLMDQLKAFRRFSRSNPGFRLEVAGRPVGLYSLMCRLYTVLTGMSDSVVYLGQVDDVPARLRRACAHVVSGIEEGFGFTVVEAMMNGCLVIGRDSGGIGEQFDKGREIAGKEIGLRYDSVESLCRQMQWAADNVDSEVADDIRKAAFDVVKKCYTTERYAREVVELYESILNDR